MDVLLDECVNRRLARALTGHAVRTVQQMGWSGIKNGQLLALAEQQFEALITVDRNMQHQQNLANHRIAVLLLVAPSIKLADLLPLVPNLLAALPSAPRGAVTVVGP
jgi:predicted nuclease of predicted toxin-antitoxin system